MGLRRWMLLLPVCALPLWALMLFTREERSKPGREGSAPAARPLRDDRAAGRRASGRRDRPASCRTSLARTVTGRAAGEGLGSARWRRATYEQQRQALELRNKARFARGRCRVRSRADRRAAAARRRDRAGAEAARGARGATEPAIACAPSSAVLRCASSRSQHPSPWPSRSAAGSISCAKRASRPRPAFSGQGQARALTIYVLDEAVSFDAL